MSFYPPDQRELHAFVRRNIAGLILFITVSILATMLLGLFFEEELVAFAEQVEQTLGIGGLMLIAFLADFLITPLPPDLLLLVVAKSPMRDTWPLHVILLGLASWGAGAAGWMTGNRLGHSPWVLRRIGDLNGPIAQKLRRFGFWTVAIGALTPFPFSVTCWTAGMLGIPLRQVLWGGLLRLPRFFLFYWVLVLAGA